MSSYMFPGVVVVGLVLLALAFWRNGQPAIEPALQQIPDSQQTEMRQAENNHVENTLEKQAVNMLDRQLTPAQYQTQFLAPARPHLLIDVRTSEEFKSGHIPGAINIELDALAARIHEVPQDRPIVLYCRSGRRSAMAAEVLARFGYSQVTDLGGIIDWQRQGLPLQ